MDNVTNEDEFAIKYYLRSYIILNFTLGPRVYVEITIAVTLTQAYPFGILNPAIHDLSRHG